MIVLKKQVLIIISICFFNTIVFSQNSKLVDLKVNWNNYLAKQDLVWDSLPLDYFQGAFVGNGLLGAIIFKDASLKNTLRFEIGRTDVYDHRVPNASCYESGRLPIGSLLLSYVGDIKQVKMRNNLWNAEIIGDIITTKGTIHFRCFVPSEEELIIVDMQTTKQESAAQFKLQPAAALSARYVFKQDMGLEKDVVYPFNPNFIVNKKDGIETVTQKLLMGDDYATAWKDSVHKDGSHTAYITVANRWGKHQVPTYGSANDAIATIMGVQNKSLTRMEAGHRKWWHEFYAASFVSLPDAKLESFYWIQLYKLGSAGHPNRPVIDLLGPWYKPTSWNLLWMNLNVQLTYSTLGTTNHPEMEDVLYQLLDRHHDQLIKNVPLEFQNDCAATGNPVGYDNLYSPLFITADKENEKEINIIVLPWLMQMYYLHYERTMDEKRLREKIYPLMRRAFNVYARIMYLGEDGLYHIPYSYSDEYGKAKETSLNIALASWGFKTLIKCAGQLKIKDPMLPKWKEILSKMADYNINANGIMVGKDLPFAKPHRHFSHLFAIFPLYDMNVDHDAVRIPMMRKSIQNFTALDGDNCMYKFSGSSSLWSAIGDGEAALTWLNRSLELLPRFGAPPGPSRIPTVTQNTFYSERENPTFESPIASSRSMLDMLMQSWGGVIRLFPACPPSWKNVSFHNLRTEGAFLVSAVRENGHTQFIRIKSLAGAPCYIKSDLGKEIKMSGSGLAHLKNKEGLLELSLPKGEEVVLYTGKKPTQFIIQAVATSEQEQNFWGTQKTNITKQKTSPPIHIKNEIEPPISLAKSTTYTAIEFLLTLTPTQKKALLFPLDSSTRYSWHYVPPTTYRRDGLPLKDLADNSKRKVTELLRAFLSAKGYEKTKGIMDLEYLLAKLEPNNNARIPENYFISIYGDPNKDSVWAWKFTGHHLALNFTVVNDKIAYAPFFFGSNPGTVMEGPQKGLRLLAAEEDLGFELVNQMDSLQKEKAIFAKVAMADIFTTNSPHTKPLEVVGISANDLTSPQKIILNKLIQTYINSMPKKIAEARMETLMKNDFNEINFAWAGSLVTGAGHYYRIQGKSFLIEFDNTQNNSNHIHTVWRDFNNGDYGLDLIQQHYQSNPHRNINDLLFKSN